MPKENGDDVFGTGKENDSPFPRDEGTFRMGRENGALGKRKESDEGEKKR